MQQGKYNVQIGRAAGLIIGHEAREERNDDLSNDDLSKEPIGHSPDDS